MKNIKELQNKYKNRPLLFRNGLFCGILAKEKPHNKTNNNKNLFDIDWL